MGGLGACHPLRLGDRRTPGVQGRHVAVQGLSGIRRFSEDVDLTFDIRAIAPDLVGEVGEALPKNRSEEKRWSSEVRRRLPRWLEGSVQPIIAEALAEEALAATIRVEGEKLFIDYQAGTAGSGYVAPSVMLEFGARSTGEPERA